MRTVEEIRMFIGSIQLDNLMEPAKHRDPAYPSAAYPDPKYRSLKKPMFVHQSNGCTALEISRAPEALRPFLSAISGDKRTVNIHELNCAMSTAVVAVQDANDAVALPGASMGRRTARVLGGGGRGDREFDPAEEALAVTKFPPLGLLLATRAQIEEAMRVARQKIGPNQ